MKRYLLISLILFISIFTGCTVNNETNDSLTDSINDDGQMDEKAIVDNINNTFIDPYPTKEIINEGTNKLISLDESKKHETLLFFINTLKQAVSDRDANKLLNLTDENIRYNNTDKGINGFKKYWQLDTNSESILWSQLEKILPLGGGFKDNIYNIPYISNIINNENTNEYGYVLNEYVNIRKEPDIKSDSLEKLNFDKITINKITNYTYTIDNIKYPWIEITTQSANKGYICSKYVYGNHDYTLGIAKNDENNWKIVYLKHGKHGDGTYSDG
jgi:hypothetical protein